MCMLITYFWWNTQVHLAQHHMGPLSFKKCPPSLAHFWLTYLNTHLFPFFFGFSTSSWLCKVNIADPDRSTITEFLAFWPLDFRYYI